ANEFDPATGNNTAMTNNPIAFDVTLSVTKSLPGPFRVGMTADYVVTVNHAGGVSYANNVQISDVLDPRLSFVSAGSSAGCSALGQTITCNAPAAVAPGNFVSFTIRVMVGGAP
ncbi:MAG TPA: hypothetical protein VLB27_02930, partial [candidate division Zixibacteria bacterium]|nr:hypothetical protein [candidate division Zixibacteria bacterium]